MLNHCIFDFFSLVMYFILINFILYKFHFIIKYFNWFNYLPKHCFINVKYLILFLFLFLIYLMFLYLKLVLYFFTCFLNKICFFIYFNYCVKCYLMNFFLINLLNYYLKLLNFFLNFMQFSNFFFLKLIFLVIIFF